MYYFSGLTPLKIPLLCPWLNGVCKVRGIPTSLRVQWQANYAGWRIDTPHRAKARPKSRGTNRRWNGISDANVAANKNAH